MNVIVARDVANARIALHELGENYHQWVICTPDWRTGDRIHSKRYDRETDRVIVLDPIEVILLDLKWYDWPV